MSAGRAAPALLLRALPTALVVAALAWGGAFAGEPPAAPIAQPPVAEPPATTPAPPAPPDVPAGDLVPPRAPADVDAALKKGVDYLLGAQNKDGSWGSPATNLWDIYAPFPGSQQAFAVASTALALIGLLEAKDPRPEAAAAAERARTWLLKNHAVGRPTTDVIYNTWAHAYALEAFALLLARETDAQRRVELRQAAEAAVDRLDRFQFAEGGWGYYNFDEKTRRPGPGSTSFTTATCLLALDRARQQGIAVPERLIPRAVTDLLACKYPDGSFAYGYYLRMLPRLGINQIKGSLARSPACLLALERWGKRITPAQAGKALDDLVREGHFLLIARKYPFPHETWYQNSGYFCFYGYYYAAQLVEHAPAEARKGHYEALAHALAPLQETDGSFWDYQLFGYHKAYGTGYVLSVLSRVRDARAAAAPAR